jgi:UDP-N-acetylglucosamine 2-epimerase
MKTVISITGIRPDFIRMSEIFKKLDKNFNHILIHTGQHYDKLLSDVFFKELNIRNPDYVLETGKNGKTHYHQLGYLSVAILEVIKNNNLHPDIILFLGDSNTVCASLPLKKEGYIIGHIEAGMRSFDKRMLEELNRTTCDHCSDILFVYHDDYKKQLYNENIKNNVHVVGNTIVEVCKPIIEKLFETIKKNNMILLDVHRPENFKYPNRLKNIISYANKCSQKYNLPVKMLKFHGTCNSLIDNNINLDCIELIDLMSYNEYLTTIYNCKFIISDSGTAQEEPSLLNTPVIVPRNFTERPQSINSNCSYLLNVDDLCNVNESYIYLNNIFENILTFDVSWLGDGNTSDLIINELNKFLNK